MSVPVDELLGEGIGLFRSEFLYLGREDYPDEETQFQAYRKVLTAMGDREVIIRTMDIGADKQIDYFNLPKEENPALGMRALRICLDRPEIFRTQLRALYRASVYGNLGIMFPMVASVWEVQEVKTRCEQVKQELIAEGIPVSESIRIGIMVETPAAALMSDRLAQLVDFFSVGFCSCVSSLSFKFCTSSSNLCNNGFSPKPTSLNCDSALLLLVLLLSLLIRCSFGCPFVDSFVGSFVDSFC